MAERDAARQQKDFKTADRIRKQLDDMGILVHDQKV
jgi:cysteinyl-tRNA synthetase